MTADQDLVEITDINRPYWEAMADGRLSFQQCGDCGHRWLPPRAECPRCLSSDRHWLQSSGHGRLISWVVYHQSFHAMTTDWVPYNVAIVELEEGPRLISNIIGVPNDALKADMALRLSPQRRDNIVVPCFTPLEVAS